MTEGWIMLIIFVILVVFAGVNLELSYRTDFDLMIKMTEEQKSAFIELFN